MPYPVHHQGEQSPRCKAEGFHTDNGHMEAGHHKNDEHIGEEEPWNGYEEIGQKGSAPVIETPAPYSGMNSHGKGERPGDERSQYKQGKAVEKPLIDFPQDWTVILPGDALPG